MYVIDNGGLICNGSNFGLHPKRAGSIPASPTNMTLNAKQQAVVDEEIERRWNASSKTIEFFRKEYIRLRRENEDLRNRLLRRAMKDYQYYQYK